MKKEQYLKIAESGTAEEFRNAFKRVAHPKMSSTREKRRLMAEKAAEALSKGKPENMQTVIATANDAAFVWNMLDVMAKKCNDLSTAIDQSFSTIPAEKKREFLNYALNSHIEKGANFSNFTCDEIFVAALLKSGADVNNRDGYVMAAASRVYNNPLSLMKLLHENGGNFDDGVRNLRTAGWNEERVEKFRRFEEQIINPPVPQKTMQDMLEILQQMQEQMVDMARRIENIEEKVEGRQPAAAPVKTAHKPYPSVS